MPQSAKRHKPLGLRTTPQNRPTANARGYNYRWQQASQRFLQSHPLCVLCLKQDKVRAATCVDHIVPHRGDQRRFWQEANWQALCDSCHGAKSAGERLS
jgi:5-methylcytosine-specific restriction protein A